MFYDFIYLAKGFRMKPKVRSTLNTDYKIATKVIGNRVRQVLPSIINDSQTGFIKGRYIGENIRLPFDIIDNAEEQNESGMIFFTDFENAFDSLAHQYLFKCLKHFSFGDNLLKWIQLLYKDTKSCVSKNGYISDFFFNRTWSSAGLHSFPLSVYNFNWTLATYGFNIWRFKSNTT